ncbi:hypothetical protein BCR32DRAFT_327577 [Anaeromyces robustus]|uniref:TtsA-like Glycoside hydrolase family 108 domain-containing protein n=1 Tax=Anaeromyces robustus TaxID=1754192 RepID=A0A1Y1X4L9_9FUNG|nr:hypothetical protein BCR32DRAFT_327577 [Anaeromyces robustus]|eukprot:ORX80759.1 hypothetical protein BCR32DRAFT_327577 [Anaeromyces robustus]
MRFSYKLLTVFLVSPSFVFGRTDDRCFKQVGNKKIEGVCVYDYQCEKQRGQIASVEKYEGSYPNWPCPNDPDNVICCIKSVTKLTNGDTLRNDAPGRCININYCNTNDNYLISSPECPGSQQVQLCVPNINKESDNNVVIGNDVPVTNTCPTVRNPNATKSGKSKAYESLPQIFQNEGLCQNMSDDRGNQMNGRIGYTCMGVTPSTGWENKKYYQYALSRCSNDPVLFIKCAFDLNKEKFKESTSNLYAQRFGSIAGCDSIPQPAYFVCLDLSLNGPYRARDIIRENPIGNMSSKEYARKLNDISRQDFIDAAYSNASQYQFLQGWLNRCAARDKYIDNYC